MSKPEQLAWQSLKRTAGREWLAQRHEDRYSVGIPDISYVMQRMPGWIELKAASSPTEPLKLRPLQHLWMQARTDAGLPCVLMVRCEKTWTGVLVGSQFVRPSELVVPTTTSRLVALGAITRGHPLDLLWELQMVYKDTLPLVGSN